jgi:hypothetical protein
MALAGTGARMAGKALEAYHNVGTSVLGEKLASALGSKLGGTASRLIEPTAQLVGAGLVSGAETVLSPVLDRGSDKKADYARQQYVPGTMPMTNEQAGYLYLDQMKLQNQLALLQARQGMMAQPQSGPTGYGQGQIDPYSSLNRILNTTYTY